MKPKRNKKYTPRPCVLPLNMRRAIAFEMPGYQASVALGQDHFCEQHLYDLRTVPNIEIDRAAREAVREFDRTGVLRV